MFSLIFMHDLGNNIMLELIVVTVFQFVSGLWRYSILTFSEPSGSKSTIAPLPVRAMLQFTTVVCPIDAIPGISWISATAYMRIVFAPYVF